MKKLFVAIRKGEIETVRELLEKKPELVACTAKQPPKQDDGQSPLQVAIKSGQFEIANILLDGGADVNFMESPDCCNPWRMPALHDAIRAAVMSCRWQTGETLDDRLLTPELEADLSRIFTLLFAQGPIWIMSGPALTRPSGSAVPLGPLPNLSNRGVVL